MAKSRRNVTFGLHTLVVRPVGRQKSRAILQAGPLRLLAALGRSGISSLKREGDGATPRASMRLINGYYRGAGRKAISTSLPMQPIRQDRLWCDDPAHPAYNRPLRAPFFASHETLWRKDGLYDLCLVLDWNITMRKRGCGSAIFFHLARPGYTPTEGCIALHPRDMRRLLPFLTRKTRMVVS
ncbi:L,D-transpeptidase family protein [Allorhizobium sp. BGMRC 0089]|uniref:L,D-transpeptidase family protein n=1 Tax=Allorhizobium sonneratiae TaxID=2934936 RepID=UPI0020345C77|nr:L,D-transpeptidase family protein [Allorhizobium sonneratiae]MCM2293334.1 L,D-transpeptidase family protein [Allorhizobium sonneratiae]